MKRFKLIIILIIFVIIAIFAFQNIPPTTITFLVYTFNISKALLTLVSAIIGFLMGIIVMLLLNRRKI
jgi:uncharacterized integral membrane protein